MVAVIVKRGLKNRTYGTEGYVSYVEIALLSTDDKPTDKIATGSMAIEVDTGDVYLFDEVGSTWTKMCSIKE